MDTGDPGVPCMRSPASVAPPRQEKQARRAEDVRPGHLARGARVGVRGALAPRLGSGVDVIERADRPARDDPLDDARDGLSPQLEF